MIVIILSQNRSLRQVNLCLFLLNNISQKSKSLRETLSFMHILSFHSYNKLLCCNWILVLFPFYRWGMLWNLPKVTEQVCGEAGFNYTSFHYGNLVQIYYETLSLSWFRCILDNSTIWDLKWEEVRNWHLSSLSPRKHACLSFLVHRIRALRLSSPPFHGEQLPINFSQPHCSVNVSISRDIILRASRQLWLFWCCQTAWVYLSYEVFTLR